MASSIFNAPCTVPAVKGKNYFGLKPAVNNDLRFNVGKKTSIIGCPKRVFTVRASEKKDGPIKKLGLSDAECEAAVVAGNVPEAPPVPPRPAAPAGTPVVPSLPLSRRPRRNRKSPVMRASFQETSISPANFVYPLFIHEGEEDTPIGAMPGCYRLGWRHGLVEEVAKARDVGVNSIVLFPKVPDALKSSTGDEAYNDNGLVPRAIQLLKDKYPDLVIYTDVALDPYSSDGHDGIVREDGVIMNDETVYQLCKQAVSQARAGADVVSPSDMMDGRVGAIRKALDAEGFQHVSIMSYTAKYASSFYGPFREALESTPRFGDKKTYQMNPANYREALVEAHEDESEGADILLVKPGLPYLDIIRLLRDKSPLPIAAYQVSGEYSMIKAGGVLKMIDEERVMMESLMCLRRAGADIILTYFALQAARCLCGEKRGGVKTNTSSGIILEIESESSREGNHLSEQIQASITKSKKLSESAASVTIPKENSYNSHGSLVQSTISTLFKKVQEKKKVVEKEAPRNSRNSSSSKVSDQKLQKIDLKRKIDLVEAPMKRGTVTEGKKAGTGSKAKKKVNEVEDDDIEEFSSSSQGAEGSDEDWEA